MLNNTSYFKYETPYSAPFYITQCWNDGTITSQYGTIKIGYNIYVILSHIYLIQMLNIVNIKKCMSIFNI